MDIPVDNEKQNNKKSLCSAILELSRAATAIGTAVLGFMAIYSTPVLSVVYGQEYAAVALPFSPLCAYAFVSIHERILGSLHLAIGLPHLRRWVVVLRAIVVVSLIYPGIALFGLAGAAGVVLVASTVALCAQVLLMRKAIGLQFWQYVRSWLPGLWLIMALALPRGLIEVIGTESTVLKLAVGALSCLVGCVISLALYRSSGAKPIYSDLVET